MLYTNAQALGLAKAAEAVVPNGESRPKNEVLKSLGIDAKRLRDRRVEAAFDVYLETWQLSEDFDLTWMTSGRDRTSLESENRQILGVRVQARKQDRGK